MVDYLSNIDKTFLMELLKNKIIPFVGAGLSRNAKIMNNIPVPDWDGLGEKFANLLTDKKNYSTPTEFISEYEKLNGKTFMIKYLYEFLNIKNIRPGDAHKAFNQFPAKTIITTNFDNLIEKSFEDDTNYLKIYESKDFQFTDPEKVNIIKLHGDFDKKDSIVITASDYEKVGNNSLYRNNIKHIIITNHVFYICYSYRDPDLQSVIDQLNSDLDPLGVTMFGLLINPNKSDIQHFVDNKIIPIVLCDPDRSRGDVLTDFFNQINQYVTAELEKHVKNDKQVITISEDPDRFVKKDTMLIGRTNEVIELTKLIQGNKIVSIIGEGGVGKTLLVFEVLRDLHDYTVFSFYINEPSYSAIMTQLYSDLKPEISSEDGIRQKLAQMKNVIIFLDNFEIISNLWDQKITDEINKIYQFLLSFPPNVTLLMASRNRKNISGEVSLILAGLSVEEGTALFLKLTTNIQITMSTEFTKYLHKMVAEIRGLPLGIKLIAGAYQGGGIDELKSIMTNIGQVTIPGEDVKHPSIKDCYSYSYEMLSESQKDMLRYIVLLKSPFNKRLFESVFSTYEFPDLLKLYNRNLLYSIQIGERDEDIYFDFHPFVRSYLEDLPEIEGGSKRLFQIRYSKYYFGLLNSIYASRKDINEFANNSRLIDLLLQRTVNDLDLILDFPISLDFRSLYANKYALVLLEFHYIYRALNVNTRCIQFDRELKDTLRIGNDHATFAAIYSNLGNYSKAISESNDAIGCYEKVNNVHDKGRVYLEMVSLHLKEDDIPAAEDKIKKYKDLFGARPIQFSNYKEYLFYKQAEFYLEFKKDDTKKASMVADEVINKYKKNEIPKRDIASFYMNKGVLLKLENYDESYQSYVNAFDIYQEYEDIPKQFQSCELILKLFKIWDKEDNFDLWENRKIKLEKEMKDKGLQFSQNEML